MDVRTAAIRLRAALAAALWALAAASAAAQEPLDAILARGHVAHWLVCGPFEGAVLERVAAGKPALDATDYMKPAGGIAALQPEHLQRIETGGAEAIWQRAGAEGPVLDLAPFFPGKEEGVAYAAFYAEAAAPQLALLEFESPAGLRVWVNGALAREIPEGPLDARAVQRIPVAFGKGRNLVIAAAPGAAPGALIAAGKTAPSAWRAARPAAGAAGGFAMALRLRAMTPLGALAYTPALEATGEFAGTVNNIAQRARITVANPGAAAGPPGSIVLRADGRSDPIALEWPPLRPGEVFDAVADIPIGNATAGTAIPVNAVLAAEGRQAVFDAALTVQHADPRAAVYVLAGAPRDPAALEAQVQLLAEEPDYGLLLGHAGAWRPLLDARPALRAPLRDAAVRERVAAAAAFDAVDERIVGGETLVRNLVYGIRTARALIDELRPAHLAFDAPGIAPQTPQLLDRAGLDGLLSDLDLPDAPPLSALFAPDGSRVWHRNAPRRPAPASAAQLRSAAEAYRKDTLALGVAADALPLRGDGMPEPFWRGAAAAMARAYPRVRADGGGAFVFFDTLSRQADALLARIPADAGALNTAAPGMLTAQPDLRHAHARTEAQLLAAERWATLAALLGAPYPDLPLDAAWRSTIRCGVPSRVAQCSGDARYVDTLAALRDAAGHAADVLHGATRYIAAQAETLGAAPGRLDGVQALLVFNPTLGLRTDLVETELTLPGLAGLGIVDDAGAPVPFYADRLRYDARRRLTGARLQFAARDVPGAGYRTYYLVPEGALPQPVFRTDAIVQSDRWLIEIDPASGNLRRIEDKRSGTALEGDFGGVTAMPQDLARTEGGREVWTAGDPLRPGPPERIESMALPWMQRVTVTAPFAGGRLVRSYTVFDGADRIGIEAAIEGAMAPAGALMVLTHRAAGAGGLAPVYGERFGATVWKRGGAGGAWRTRAPREALDAAPYPAHQWAAVTPGDALRLGSARVAPLGPALIVQPADGALGAAARTLLDALVRRGIPARIATDAPGEAEAALRERPAFVCAIGGPGLSRYALALAKALPGPMQQRLAAVLDTGAAVYLDAEGVPVLLLAADSAAAAAQLAQDAAGSVSAAGHTTVPESLVLAEEPGAAPPALGFAVLFHGTLACNTQADGTLVTAFGTAPDAAAAAARPLPEETRIRYALRIVEGDWHEAGLAQSADRFQFPLTTALTGLHSGSQPGRQALLALDQPGAVLTALYPAEPGRGALRAAAPHPRDGFAVRLFEPVGRPWQGRLSLFAPLADAAETNLLAQPGAALPVEGAALALGLHGFGIGSWWVLPREIRAGSDAGDDDTNERKQMQAAADCDYWTQEDPIAPLGNLPIAIAFEGAPPPEGGAMRVRVANQLGDARAEGALVLSAAAGWSVGPERMVYALAPGETQVFDLALAPTPQAAGPPAVAAATEYGGQTCRAVWGGPLPPLTASATRTLGQIAVRIENPGPLPALGAVDLAVPAAHWPELGGLPRVTVSPARQAIAVPAGGMQEVSFAVSAPDAPLAAVARVRANGQTVHAAVPARGTPPG